MANAKINSDNIAVFPTSHRGAKQRSARLISESNLIGLANRLLDKDSFVISDSIVPSEPFEFNIHGYYFKITSGDAMTNLASSIGGNNIWATIELETTTTATLDTFVELKGSDEEVSGGYEYGGVVFSDANPVLPKDTTKFSLKILTKSGSTYVVPSDSKIKYEASKVFGDITTIDGGDV